MVKKNVCSGIYIITNTINGKVYIGQSKDIANRWRKHKYNLRRNIHTNSHLQSAFNIDGEDSFKFDTLEECTKELRNDREVYWINYYKATDSNYGYNYQSGGCGRQTIADETKQKISKGLTGRPVSEETRKKIGNANRGKKASAELSAKLSAQRKGRKAWNKGIPQSEEQKLAHSKRMTGRKNSGMTGKTHSEETRKRLSEATKEIWRKKKGI